MAKALCFIHSAFSKTLSAQETVVDTEGDRESGEWGRELCKVNVLVKDP